MRCECEGGGWSSGLTGGTGFHWDRVFVITEIFWPGGGGQDSGHVARVRHEKRKDTYGETGVSWTAGSRKRNSGGTNVG